MPTSDNEIIQSILAAALSNSHVELLNPRPGELKVVPQMPEIKTPEEAWSEFEKFGGPGWLQNAHTREILHGEASEMKQHLANVMPDERWPVTGERASASPDKKTSLHLRRTTKGWSIATITETDDADGILLTRRLLSADCKNYLVYDVAYARQQVNGHEELRPFASRFVGFEPVPPPTH